MNATIPPIKNTRNECRPSKGTLLLPLVLITGICFSSVAGAENEKCLGYDPEVVTLTGKLKEESHPGPPEYASIQQGDRPELFWFVYLEKPVCVRPRQYETYVEEGEKNVKKVQLILHGKSLYGEKGNLVNNRVRATGKLLHAISPHHHTEILISLEGTDSIKPATQ